MLIINNQQALNEFCSLLKCNSIISIDTEFSRHSTYYAKLSTIQIKGGENIAIIDALNNIDLSPICSLLIDENILKIFHAPREDFEIFYYLFKKLPKNVFDIQTAANACGLGKNLSYNDICIKICGVGIDKTYQKADWLQRPLTKQIINYALTDIKYLEQIYFSLLPRIRDTKSQQEFISGIAYILDLASYSINIEDTWQKVKFFDKSRSFISKMKILASYREAQAQIINLPRKHFLKDEDLIKLCQYLPTNNREFEALNIDNFYLNRDKNKNKYCGNYCSLLRNNSN